MWANGDMADRFTLIGARPIRDWPAKLNHDLNSKSPILGGGNSEKALPVNPPPMTTFP
jgi:hypothetical protein